MADQAPAYLKDFIASKGQGKTVAAATTDQRAASVKARQQQTKQIQASQAKGVPMARTAAQIQSTVPSTYAPQAITPTQAVTSTPTATAQPDYAQQFQQMSETYQQAFEGLSDILGEQQDAFQKQLETVQKQTGMMVDIEKPGFTEAIQQAIPSGEFGPTMQQYLAPRGETAPKTTKDLLAQREVPMDEIKTLRQRAIDGGLDVKEAESAMVAFQNGVLNAGEIANYFRRQLGEDEVVQGEPVPGVEKTNDTNYNIESTNISPPGSDANAVISDIGAMDLTSLEGLLMNTDWGNMSSAQTLQTLMLAEIQEINSPEMKNYFTKMIQSADSAYQSSLEQGQVSLNEMNSALEGEEFVPTTYEGLAAKVYSETKEIQLASIDLEKQYRDDKYNNWLSGEREKRGRLEGYLKAKLYASGAQDSSAGLQTMALAVNAADLRLQDAQADHMYGMSKLNLESRQIMTNYTNNILKLGLDVENKKAAAATKYDEKLLEIEGMVIADEREKRKLTLGALSEFNDKLYKYDQDKKAEERDIRDFSYKATQDAVDEAWKISGATGFLYYHDPEKGTTEPILDDAGNLIPTFERKKWEGTNLLNWAQEDRMSSNALWGRAMDFVDAGDYEAAAQMIGEDPAYFSQFKTKDEMAKALKIKESNLKIYNSMLPGLVGANGSIASVYTDGYTDGTPDGIQCGEFMHEFFTDYPYMLNTLSDKMSIINPNQLPEVGAAVIMNATYKGEETGHIAIINKINEDGSLVLTESNARGDGRVSNTNVLNPKDPKIMGYWKGTLKPRLAEAFESMQDQQAENYFGIALNEGVAAAKTRLGDELGGGEEGRLVEKKFNLLIEQRRSFGSGYNLGNKSVLPTIAEADKEVESALKKYNKANEDDSPIQRSQLRFLADSIRGLSKDEAEEAIGDYFDIKDDPAEEIYNIILKIPTL